jgi:hypothetical protein
VKKEKTCKQAPNKTDRSKHLRATLLDRSFHVSQRARNLALQRLFPEANALHVADGSAR